MAPSCAPRRRTPRSARFLGRVGIVVVTAVAVGGCGERGATSDHDRNDGNGPGGPDASPAANSRPDLSTPLAALTSASKALDAGDLVALDACLTTEGALRVRRDLAAWKALLADPTTGPRVLSRIPPARDEGEKAAYVAGFGGDSAGLLRMLARATATPGTVARADVGALPAGAARIEGDRVLSDGTRRRAVLVHDGSSWRVDRLAL